MKPPKTNYTKVGDSLVAYSVVGEGSIDLVYSSGMASSEALWDHPIPARFLEELASFTRLIQFDPRGWGASDRFGTDRFPTWEDWAEDLRAVLDAVGSERAAIFTTAMASLLAMIFAATYPDRTSALIMFNSTARFMTGEGYPWGLPSEQVANEVVRMIEQGWGTEEFVVVTQPNVAGDERYKTWSAKAMRMGGSPRMAAEMIRYMHAFDSSSFLPAIQAPTLVLHRTLAQWIPVERGRHLAENIPGAKLIELPGTDEAPFTEHAEEIVGHIEEFLTGVRRAPEPDRVLATVLFTDIVSSTERAAELGDAKWKKVLDAHDSIAREQIEAHRGRLVNTTGDGMIATFDGPARAIRCATALHDALRNLGVEIRAGLHTGEVELRGEDVGGIAVHIGARVMANAGSGEVLVSGSVPPLVVGSGIEFEDRGTRELKGVPGEWRLFAVRS